MSLITIQRHITIVQEHPDAPGAQSRARVGWRRRVSVGGVLLATTGLSIVVGAATASPSPHSSTTNVAFVPLAAPFKLFTAKTFLPGAQFAAVVLGGATKVPTNATTVELSVVASSATEGSMNFYPTGNPGGGSGQVLSWGGGRPVTGTVEENVGTSDEVTFVNLNRAVTVSASIIGYSTQVTAGDINGTDGTPGQVLTNNGAGAEWQTQGQAYANSERGGVGINASTGTTVDSLTVPAGSYLVTDTFEASSTVADFASCWLQAPDGGFGWAATAALVSTGGEFGGSGTAQMLMKTVGGTITLQCTDDTNSGATVDLDTLIAIQVNAASGATVN